MTLQASRGVSRPFAIVFALVAMAAFWIPTVTSPAVADSADHATVVVIAATGAYAPVLM